MTPLDPTALVVAYLRVSTRGQANGPHAQRASIEAWAAQHGVTVAAWHQDLGVSGTDPVDSRPGLLAALADLTRLGATTLVVTHWDRLARDPSTASAITARLGTAHVVTTDTSLDRAAQVASAHLELSSTRARTKAALASRKARGLAWTGHLPLGLTVDPTSKVVTPHPGELAAVTHVLDLRNQGTSLRGIVASLNATFPPPRKAKTWHLTQVRRILANAGK